ncbi:uncharacterized protein LOC143040349 isoform X1 [Oratosquilla oratoria]|uniref:uncharacterized protein LOC143040349 isoform X1 n=1 Tax=Oratosquilla oratoria TaxID=337810 RepID=UPI003F7711F9
MLFSTIFILIFVTGDEVVVGNVHGTVVNTRACREGPFHVCLESGTIISPLRPNSPPKRMQCSWVIDNPKRDTLIFSFSNFGLEPRRCGRHVGCCPHQWVSIFVLNKYRNYENMCRTKRKKRELGFRKALLQSKRKLAALNEDEIAKDTTAKEEESSSTYEYDNGTGELCGHMTPRTFVTNTSSALVIFFSSDKVRTSGIGFKIQYTISNNRTVCNSEEFQCKRDHLCIPASWECNGQTECPDGTDETNCQAGCPGLKDHQHCNGRWDCLHGEDELGCFGCNADELWCGEGQACYKAYQRCDSTIDCPNGVDEKFCIAGCNKNYTRCSSTSDVCYNYLIERCDNILQCPGGEDEIGCDSRCGHEIACSTGEMCYSAAERCDGVMQCSDASDEIGCSSQLCHSQRGAFLCANRLCVSEACRCNKLDECGDASDEEDCLRNSVIAAAAMGGLVCSLLLVIAVGCTCRLYALRIGFSSSSRTGHRVGHRSTPLSPLSRLEQHLLQREPPPSYAVAVNDPALGNYYGSSRSGRNWRRHRRRRPAGPPPPPPEGLGSGVGVLPSLLSCGLRHPPSNLPRRHGPQSGSNGSHAHQSGLDSQCLTRRGSEEKEEEDKDGTDADRALHDDHDTNNGISSHEHVDLDEDVPLLEDIGGIEGVESDLDDTSILQIHDQDSVYESETTEPPNSPDCSVDVSMVDEDAVSHEDTLSHTSEAMHAVNLVQLHTREATQETELLITE